VAPRCRCGFFNKAIRFAITAGTDQEPRLVTDYSPLINKKYGKGIERRISSNSWLLGEHGAWPGKHPLKERFLTLDQEWATGGLRAHWPCRCDQSAYSCRFKQETSALIEVCPNL